MVYLDSFMNCITTWYWSDLSTAGLTRYLIQSGATPIRCAKQLYFATEQLLYTFYAAPWDQKLPVGLTVLVLTTRSIFLDLFQLLAPLYSGQLSLCPLPNQPQLHWGSPFGLGRLSMECTRKEVSRFGAAYPTLPLDYRITNGHCWGISMRISQLFFEKKTSIPDAEKRLISIAKSFSGGAPSEAQRIQALGCTRLRPRSWESSILLLQAPLRVMWTLFSSCPAWLTRCSFSEAIQETRFRYDLAWQEGALLPHAKLALRSVFSIHQTEDLVKASNGVYLVRQGRYDSHEMVFIKLSNHLCFTVNPGWGLYRHAGPDCAKNAAQILGVGCQKHLHLISVAPRRFYDRYPLELPWRWSTLFV